MKNKLFKLFSTSEKKIEEKNPVPTNTANASVKDSHHVLIILNDIGFGASSAFSGSCDIVIEKSKLEKQK